MRVTLKECVWTRSGEDLVVVFDPREVITLSDPTGRIAALLTELSRTPQTAAELAVSVKERGFEVTEADIGEGLRGLDGLGLVEDADQRGLGTADDDERHFSTLTFFGTYTDLATPRAEFVRRLQRAHVLVLGVGGGGSSLVQCLAGLGVGRLTLVDRDVVERRNFSRQFLYRRQDLDRPKVERAVEWVRAFDPDITVRGVDRWVAGPEDLTDLLEGVDVVAGGLDGHQDAGLWVNEAAVRAGAPLVTGLSTRTQLMYSSVDPGRTPCLACDWSGLPDPRQESSASVARGLLDHTRLANPVIGPVAMQIGSLVAQETLRYLTGCEPPVAAGVRVVLDLRAGLAAERHPFTRDPDCPVCAQAPVRGVRQGRA